MDDIVSYTVRLPRDVGKKAEKTAAAAGVSVNDVITLFLLKGLNQPQNRQSKKSSLCAKS